MTCEDLKYVFLELLASASDLGLGSRVQIDFIRSYPNSMTPAQVQAYRKVFDLCCRLERRSPGKIISTVPTIEEMYKRLKKDLTMRDGKLTAGTTKQKDME